MSSSAKIMKAANNQDKKLYINSNGDIEYRISVPHATTTSDKNKSRPIGTLSSISSGNSTHDDNPIHASAPTTRSAINNTPEVIIAADGSILNKNDINVPVSTAPLTSGRRTYEVAKSPYAQNQQYTYNNSNAIKQPSILREIKHIFHKPDDEHNNNSEKKRHFFHKS